MKIALLLALLIIVSVEGKLFKTLGGRVQQMMRRALWGVGNSVTAETLVGANSVLGEIIFIQIQYCTK